MFWSKNKKLEALRNLWGKHIEKHRNFDLISSYHRMLQPKNSNLIVDDKTWEDLNFDSIFTKIDRNISGIGQQYLFHILRKYERDENVLKNRYDLISYLKNNPGIREQIQLKLFKLEGISSYFISYLLLNKTLPYTKFYPIFYLLSFSSVVSLLLISYNSIFLFVLLGILLTNLIINQIFSSKIYEYFAGFSGLNNLLSSAISISEIETKIKIDELIFLKSKKVLLKSLKSKVGHLVIDKQYLNEFTLAFIEYLNMFMRLILLHIIVQSMCC